MWLIVLEALAALAIFVFLIWWTMFSGRKDPTLDNGADPVKHAHDDKQRED